MTFTNTIELLKDLDISTCQVGLFCSTKEIIGPDCIPDATDNYNEVVNGGRIQVTHLTVLHHSY